MLGRRLLSAAVIIAFLIGMIVVDFYLGRDDVFGRQGLILLGLAMIVAGMSAHEYSCLLRSLRKPISSIQNTMIAVIGVGICGVPTIWRDYPSDCPIGVFGWITMAFAFTNGMSLLLEIRRYHTNAFATVNAALSCLILNLIILLFGFFIAHRLLFFDNAIGMISLIVLITSVKMSDALAYFIGNSFGKNRLAPVLSPSKTKEGFFGGLAGALVGAALVIYLVAPVLFKIHLNISAAWLVIYSIAVAIAGVVGDLVESMLKRDAQIKDSSSWLPGLGGVLDITDSLVFAAPISYFMWVLTK